MDFSAESIRRQVAFPYGSSRFEFRYFSAICSSILSLAFEKTPMVPFISRRIAFDASAIQKRRFNPRPAHPALLAQTESSRQLQSEILRDLEYANRVPPTKGMP